MLGINTQAFIRKNQRHFFVPLPLAHSGYAFECERHTLTDSDAHRGKPKLAAAVLEAVSRRQRQTRARHAERMTKRNRTAVRVDVLGIIGKPQLPQAS